MARWQMVLIRAISTPLSNQIVNKNLNKLLHIWQQSPTLSSDLGSFNPKTFKPINNRITVTGTFSVVKK